jgi:hypothetical protein
MLAHELQAVGLGGVADNDPVAAELLHGDVVLHRASDLDAADVLHGGDARGERRRKRD